MRGEDDYDNKALKKPEATFSCTKCGADVTDNDDKCPKCGELFDDDDELEEDGEGESPSITIMDPEGSDLEIVDPKTRKVVSEAKADFTCSKCGADVYDSDKKCRECGEVIEGEEIPDFTCTSCGADAYDSDDKCAGCGEPFEGEETPGKHACPHCDKEISEKLNFCPHCGKSIN